MVLLGLSFLSFRYFFQYRRSAIFVPLIAILVYSSAAFLALLGDSEHIQYLGAFFVFLPFLALARDFRFSLGKSDFLIIGPIVAISGIYAVLSATCKDVLWILSLIPMLFVILDIYSFGAASVLYAFAIARTIEMDLESAS